MELFDRNYISESEDLIGGPDGQRKSKDPDTVFSDPEKEKERRLKFDFMKKNDEETQKSRKRPALGGLVRMVHKAAGFGVG